MMWPEGGRKKTLSLFLFRLFWARGENKTIFLKVNKVKIYFLSFIEKTHQKMV